MNHAFAALAGALGSTLAQWRPILILWLLGLAFAASITAPWESALSARLDHLPQSNTLLSEAHVEDFLDLLRVESSALGAARAQAEGLSFVWVVLGAVLLGGLAARMLDRKQHKSWLAASGRYGFRTLLLLGMTLLALAALVPLNDLVSAQVTRWLTGENHDASATLLGWSMTAKTLLMALLAGLVTTTGQLARVRMVAREERVAPLTWLRTLGMLLRSPLRTGLMTVGLARLLSLWPIAVLWVLYDSSVVASLGSDEGPLGVLRGPWRVFLVLQVFQLGVVAAIVYRVAVLVKLWPALAPSLPVVAAPGPPPGDSLAGPHEGVAPGDASPAPTQPAPADTAPPTPAPAPASDAPSAEADTERRNDATGGAGAALATAILVLAISAGTLVAQDGGEAPVEPPTAGGAAQAEPVAQPEPAPTQTSAPVQQPPAAASRAPSATSDSLSEERAAYVIEADIDLAERTVTGREQATFLNTTSRPVNELWLHLYAAAFAHTDTQWQDNRSSASRRTPDDGGTIDVRSVRLADGTDLRNFSRIEETLLHVRLPASVPPGGEVTLDIEFVTRFPRILARMGMTAAHLDGMQWYPKFAVHDESGWTAQPFYGTGEFFADFARYEVHFRYPTLFGEQPVELEATGVPGERLEGGDGFTRVTYRQGDVHDFAFCVDPAFRRYTDSYTFEASGREVEIVYLCQPYAEPKAPQVLDAMKSYLRDSAEWWMEYPYPRIVLDGLPHSRGGGMEYPMLFTISQRQPNHLGALVDLFEDPLSVTAHEFGHQYWYGILASNEVEEAWLDEGFNTWGTARLEQSYFGPGSRTDLVTLLDRAAAREVLNGAWRGRLPFLGRSLAPQQVLGWSRSPFHDLEPDPPASQRKLLGFSVPGMDSWNLLDMQDDRMAWMRTRYANSAGDRALDTPSRDFTRGYGLVYRKTALVLETLRRHVGEAAMDRVIKTYVARFRFQHPTKDDFLGVVSEVTGGAHDVWLRALIETEATLDVAVEDVTARKRSRVGFTHQKAPGDPVTWNGPESVEEPESAPIWERAWSSVFSVPFPGSDAPTDDDESAGADTPATDTDGEPDEWFCRFVVRRHGDIPIPVEIEATFADGSVQRETWSEPGSYRIFELESPVKLESVRVDPARKIAVDLNRLNDGYRVRGDDHASQVLGEHGRFLAQSWLNGWLLAF